MNDGIMNCVLSGVSLVSTAGDDVATLFDAIDGGPALARTTRDGIPAAPIPDFDPKHYMERKGLKHLSRTSQLACAAASLLQGRLADTPSHTVGVVLGTAWAALDTIVRFEHEAHVEGPRFVDPLLFTETVGNVPASQISIIHGWSAANITLSDGTGSGLAALQHASWLVEEDRASVVVAGGADALHEHLLRSLHAEGMSSKDATGLPYCERTGGLVGSEAACLFLVEEERQAKEWGRPVLARLRAGVNCFVGPDEGHAGASELLLELVESAGWSPEQLDLIVLSGNGVWQRDSYELAAVSGALGTTPHAVVPKAVLGETWAASGPLGVAVAIEAMERGRVPAAAPGFDAPTRQALRLPEASVERDLRRAIVIDWEPGAPFTALAVERPAAP